MTSSSYVEGDEQLHGTNSQACMGSINDAIPTSMCGINTTAYRLGQCCCSSLSTKELPKFEQALVLR